MLRKISSNPFNNLRGEILNNIQPYFYEHKGNQDETDNKHLEAFKEKYIEPFYFYVDEQIDNQRVVLSFTLRYKHRSEWFNNEFFGYLIIYNISDGELEFEFKNTMNGLPIYEYYRRTIIFIVIDINKTQADSKAGKTKVYTVKEKHLSDEKELFED